MAKLVSIITPMYNSEEYICHTIDSVVKQTYENFELIIVDDLSTDNSKRVVLDYAKVDSRVKYFSLKEKGGASTARNYATEKAQGDYIAFLDSDDIWVEDKLEKQIEFMESENIYFSYTDYGFIDYEGGLIKKIRMSPETLTYKRLLYVSSSIGCLTAVYNAQEVGKIYIPYLKKRNDVAIWQRILKKGYEGHRLEGVYSYKRNLADSLSRQGSKVSLVEHHYKLYRGNLDFGILKSLYYTIFNVLTFIIVKIRKEKSIQEDEIYE